jgi:ketosteroid isomerase-like protein
MAKEGTSFMKSIAIATLVFMMSVFATNAAGESDKVFRDLENRISHAVMTGDVKAMDSLLAANYESVGFSGQVRSKAEVMAAYAGGKLAISDAHEDKTSVRQFGDTAIIIGVLSLTGKDGSTNISGHYTFTRVYKRTNGKWQAISFQATPTK